MHIFTLSNVLSPWHATAFLYHLRLSALGAADKINIRSVQFGSLIWPTRSAKARRASIFVCCIYFIYYISTLLYLSHLTLPSATHSFASPFFYLFFLRVGVTQTSPSLIFSFIFSASPLSPSEGVLLKIRPGGFFNVSLEVGFFRWGLSPEMWTPHSQNSLIWPCRTIFYFFIDLLPILHQWEV